jgi:hypothetical protein
MRTYFAFLATAALLVACSDSSRSPTAPSRATPSFDVTADAGQIVYGYQGGDVGTTEVSANSAVTFRGFACGTGPGGLTFDSHATVSNSGNTELYCKAQQPEGTEPPQAIVLTGFICGTPGGTTTDSHLVISPSGNVVLQCHTKA